MASTGRFGGAATFSAAMKFFFCWMVLCLTMTFMMADGWSLTIITERRRPHGRTRTSVSKQIKIPGNYASLLFAAVSSTTSTSSSSFSSLNPPPKKNRQFQQPRHSSSYTFIKEDKGVDESQSRSAEKNHRRSKFGADSQLGSRHLERLKTAGRPGTKRYQDPNKVFLGNLPFNLTNQQLRQWLSEQFAIPAPLLLQQCKIIQDWKTGQSKGYGFAIFSEPIYATVCLEQINNNRQIGGRILRVEPGFKKQPDPTIYLQQKEQKRLVAAAATPVPSKKPKMDPAEKQMLLQLDPDLVDEDVVVAVKESDSETSNYDDDNSEGVDDNWLGVDDDIPVFIDGKEIYGDKNESSLMNRQQRREVARKHKKKKPSNKGFG